jgi:hypothetical protein
MEIRQPRVVIIAAGMSTMAKQRGALIDTFDIVVRVNGFSTDKQYRPFVGTKTDVWFLQCGSARAYMRAERLAAQSIKKVVTVGVPPELVMPSVQANKGCVHEAYPSDRHATAKTLLGFHPSTGILAIDWAVNIAGYAVVYYIGIDAFQGGGAHYWNDEKFSPKKDRFIAAELRWLESWRDRGAAYPLDEYEHDKHKDRVRERARRIGELTGHMEPITG